MLQANTAQAQANYQVGARVCQYMNINQARKLEYRSEGALNTNTTYQWVVCPMGAIVLSDNKAAALRVRLPRMSYTCC